MLQPTHQSRSAAFAQRLILIRKAAQILKFGGTELPEGRKILIVTDAWDKINGVVTTVNSLTARLKAANYDVKIIHPQIFSYVPLKKFGADIAVPLALQRKMAKEIESYQPDRVFVITEGPLGWAARNYCVSRQIPFSSNYTTKWPEYLQEHLKLPMGMTYAVLRKFHNTASSVLVTTRSLFDDLTGKGFKNLVLWSRAVDTQKFKLMSDEERQAFRQAQGLAGRKPPFYLYVGRVAKEKNLDIFLDMLLPGTKIVVGPEGGGYTLEGLKKKYPDIVFTGPKQGKELTDFYSASDVFVFPSKTDTFGLVLLEALASGLPAVAFDVTGPKDVIDKNSKVGYLAQSDAQLRNCAIQAWQDLKENRITREQCREYALPFSWDQAVRKLIENLKIIRWSKSKVESNVA